MDKTIKRFFLSRCAPFLYGAVGIALLFFCAAERGRAQTGGQTMPWAASLANAQRQAAQQNRLVMVDFYTEWCGPCKMLEQTTYRDAAVLRLCQQIVPVKIEADKGQGIPLAKRYEVRAYPTILFLRPDGQVVERLVGSRPPQRFIPEVKKILSHWASVRNTIKPALNPLPPGDAVPVDKAALVPAPPTRTDVVLEDFERSTFDRWAVTGDCWGQGTEQGIEGASFSRGMLNGWQGNFFLTTAHARRASDTPDSGVGRAVSPPFVLTGQAIVLRVAGGRHPDDCCVRLLVEGKAVRSATGEGDLAFRTVQWDIREWAGKRGQIEIVDERRFGPKGFLFVDNIVQVAALISAAPNLAAARRFATPVRGEAANAPDPREEFGAVPPPSDIPASDNQRRALAMVNSLRQAAALPPYRWDRRIAAAAQAHSDYTVKNHRFGHDEEANLPGFTGANSSARAAAAGYPTGVWEDITSAASSPESGVLRLFLVPYHRKPILHASARDIGIGISASAGSGGNSTMTLDFAVGRGVGTVVWPYNGQTGVPVLGSVAESPYPLRIYNLPSSKAPSVGYVVSYFHFGSDLRVASAELRSEDGQLVDCWVNTPTNDEHMRDGVLLIPKRPLAPSTSYVAAVSASDGRGRDLSRRWTFRTAGQNR